MEEQQEEVTFPVKYLGSAPVGSAANEAVTADAIKTILGISKAGRKKCPRVNLSVTMKGIKVTNPTTNEVQIEVSIYR